MAQLSCSFNLDLPGNAQVVGTKGSLRLPQTFWSPSKLETPSVSRHLGAVFHSVERISFILQGVLEFPLPKPSRPTIFVNSEGLCYEADEVRKCISQGRIESEAMPLEHSLIVSEIMKTAIIQLGSCIYD